jgi:hypothetical protein
MQAISNAKQYDWATWLMGLWRSTVQGGAGAVVSGLATIGIDPDHFNLTTGLGDVFKMIGTVFLVMGVIHMFVFLQTHGAPEAITSGGPDV